VLVIDASIALTWCFEDEVTEATEAIGTLVDSEGAVVPDLWRLEVANILEIGVRRGRNDAIFREATLADLSLLPISVDPETDRQGWGATMQLAHRRRSPTMTSIHCVWAVSLWGRRTNAELFFCINLAEGRRERFG